MRERRRAVGRATGRHAIRLRGVADRIDDFRVGIVLEENRFATGIQAEAELRLVEHQKAAWRDRRPRRNHELICLGIVGDYATGETHDAIAIIV